VRRLVAVVGVVLAVALSPVALGGQLPLATRLANALAAGGTSSSSGAIALDLTTGEPVFERNADLALAPASNEKLTITYTALHELGATYRFRTEVLARGSQDGDVWTGDVYLKGFGDPTLGSDAIDDLATQIAQLGIRRIAGRVLADESWFDSRRVASGWKAGFLINECAPLSALVVDRARYDGHVALAPALAAAGILRRQLVAHGVTVGPVSRGIAPADAYALAQVESAPLADVIEQMDRDSDNFDAEMLAKEIGAEVGDAGTTAAGMTVVRRDLAAADVPLLGVHLVDGSGLSLLDRVTPRALAALLVAAWHDLDMHDAFWRALPTAGVNGTLEDRMTKLPARGAVHAKTGTTDRASALSGYVGDRYVFAVLQNGWPVSYGAARRAQDRFATALASTLGE
jgi:serine-type D-Ala-D-Ala carboxypeptidase/endopeptidase (penicillin-binding protein 4)